MAANFTSQNAAIQARYVLSYAEHGRMFPPRSLEARDMILN